jgi:chemotaxis protein methyltransferase CheR
MPVQNVVPKTPTDSREFELSHAELERVRKLIYKHAGISLSEGKREMVYSRLSRRLRERGLTSFSRYLDLLDDGDAAEWETFTNALTTNLTAFFRESHHFPILAEHVKARAARGRIGLWCSAASTGEEPYSIAMTVVEAFGSFTPPVRIIATDVDTQVLAKADAGVYPLERLEKLPRQQLEHFFLKGKGARAGFARVRPELRALITFRALNLLDRTWPLRGPLDAIFCRNVMIYFDKPTQRRILEKFAPLLDSGGLLFAGHSESFQHAADLFSPQGKTVYRLTSDTRPRHA